jgi:hypothetical protein
MAILLGVAEVVLDQAQSPLLAGGGDAMISGASGAITAPKALIANTLQAPPLAERVQAIAPWSVGTLYFLGDNGTIPVKVKGGIPSQEHSLGDPEVTSAGWMDTVADAAWTTSDPADVIRSIDHFHPVPDVPERVSSWAEWLYFNGRASSTRFYLTLLAGPPSRDGRRSAGVRLQLERNGRMESYASSASLTADEIARAPELSIGGNSVRLVGPRYEITLDVRAGDGQRLTGDLFIESHRGRQLPPIEIHGARGWVSGYTVPVMSGTLGGSLRVGRDVISLDNGAGYHDHNWGFWKGVSWQWGEVQDGGLSIVFGRVFPPRDAADPERIPGFLAAIGPEGPLGFATRVAIDEVNAAGTTTPEQLTVRGRSATVDLALKFSVTSLTATRLGGPMEIGMNFLQMRGRYTVNGVAGDQTVAFQSPGSAETFRGQ